MESTWLTRLLSAIMMCSVICLSAPTEKGSVVERDTDQVSALREKLIRLSNLLSSLDEDEEKDLQGLSRHQEHSGKTPQDTPTSENMGRNSEMAQDEKTTEVEPTVKPERRLVGPKDESIHTLAKALANLREPSYNTEDSTGEYLATGTEPLHEDKQTLDMEKMIEMALTRLSQGKTSDIRGEDEAPSRPGQHHLAQEDGYGEYNVDYGVGGRQRQRSEQDDRQLREEAIKVVETRLMQDIVLANKLGISVDDLIHDLDNKAYREAKLRKIERELSDLKY